MDKVKVSIIIPVYNVEKYIAECLESCIHQTLKEIEIIVIDDGSKDSSLDIVRQYSKHCKKLRIITQSNMGAGIARNNGILAAKGEFVAFMDPDDFYYSSEVLEKLYTKAKENEVKICGGSLVHLVDGAIELQKDKKNPFIFSGMGGGGSIIAYRDYQYDYGYTRFIYAREFLIQNSVFFPNYRRYQDPPFFIKAMALASQFYAIYEPVYVYRKSHKKIEWTEQRVIDVINGICDCMRLSLQYKLNQLYIHILKDYIFSKNFRKEVFQKFYRNVKVQDKIFDMLDLVKYSVVCKYSLRYCIKYRLKVFYLKLKLLFLRKYNEVFNF